MAMLNEASLLMACECAVNSKCCPSMRFKREELNWFFSPSALSFEVYVGIFPKGWMFAYSFLSVFLKGG